MKVRKIFIGLTFSLSFEIQVGVWQTDQRSLALVKRRKKAMGLGVLRLTCHKTELKQ